MKNIGKGVSLFQLIPKKEFNKLCDRYKINKRARSLTAQTQVMALIHAYVLRLESLREIEGTFGVPRSTLSDANSSRRSEFFEELCKLVLWRIHDRMSACKIKKAIRNVLAVDSTEVRTHGSLSKLKKWSTKRSSKVEGKASAKLHVIWDLNYLCVDDFKITAGRDHDSPVAKTFTIKANSTYVFDRAYNEVLLWYKIVSAGSHLVSRLKSCTRYRSRRFSIMKATPDAVGVLAEREWIPSASQFSKFKDVPKDFKLRHITYRCPESKKIFEFVTSDFKASAQEIADIYKKRWSVELLFRWLKSHLKIRAIDARNTNAVEILLSVAVLVQLLVRLYHLISKFKGTLWDCLRAIRIHISRVGIDLIYRQVPF